MSDVEELTACLISDKCEVLKNSSGTTDTWFVSHYKLDMNTALHSLNIFAFLSLFFPLGICMLCFVMSLISWAKCKHIECSLPVRMREIEKFLREKNKINKYIWMFFSCLPVFQLVQIKLFIKWCRRSCSGMCAVSCGNHLRFPSVSTWGSHC